MKKENTKLTEQKARSIVEAEVMLPNEILIEVDERKKLVLTTAYITAKTKQLKEFGYGNLTEWEVKKQLQNILSDKPRNIIGSMMEDEVVRPT